MPSITVWKCSGGSANSRTIGCSACATGCCGVPSNARATSCRHHASFVRATAGIGHLVDDVVDFAAERIERGDRAAARRRQEQEAVVEARAALRGLLLAVLVGCHAAALREGTSAWYATAHQSRVAQHRAAREHVAVDRVDAREDAQAAFDHRGQFEPEAPRQCARERPSRCEQRARARRLERRERAPAVVGALRGDLRLGDAEAREVFRGQVDAILPPVDRHVLPEIGQLQARCRSRRSRRRFAGASAPYSASRIRPTGLAERRQ